MKTDLHIHTTASDGTWSPSLLVENILNAGIGIFSVTDHDSTDNLIESAALAEYKGLCFIPGVEINASHQNKYVHVLGYNIDITCDDLKAVLSANRRFVERKAIEVIGFLEKKGYSVSENEYRAYNNDPARGGWKTLNYLIDKGMCTNHRDFFRLFGNGGSPFDEIGYVSPEDAIASIKKAGGTPVLAHPGARVYTIPHHDIIDLAMEWGIEGIECFHPENSVKVTQYCLEICKKNSLLITGGSDCHGDFVKERSLGKPDITLKRLELGGLM